MTDTVQEWQLSARPVGRPVPEDFRLVERELPAPAEGEVRVRNTFLSVDPYMRALMSATAAGSLAYGLGPVRWVMAGSAVSGTALPQLTLGGAPFPVTTTPSPRRGRATCPNW
ncbi:hypothetical protein [Streptomyces nigrescens]